MKPKAKQAWKAFIDSLGLYVFSLIGVFMIKYLPAYVEGEEFMFEFSWGRFAISCVLAFIVLFSFESQGDQEAKKGRFKKRALHALMYGMSAYSLIGG